MPVSMAPSLGVYLFAGAFRLLVMKDPQAELRSQTRNSQDLSWRRTGVGLA